MDKVYADLVRRGLKTLDEVPTLIRPRVEELLGIPGSEGEVQDE